MATLRLVLRVLTMLCAVAALLAVGCGDDDSDDSSPAQGESNPVAAEAGPAGGCKDAETPEPKPDGGEKKPSKQLDPDKTYEVTIETSCGSFTVRLDQKTAPATAASFASLAKKGFYDNTVFHRIVPGFVIQGGDPTGTGTGGPGYSVVDEPPSDAAYTRGVVAMAKTGTEPPGTSGSQFYVVTGADAGLPPEYALLGKVVKGLGVTKRIEALGDPQSGGQGTPVKTVVLEKATLAAR